MDMNSLIGKKVTGVVNGYGMYEGEVTGIRVNESKGEYFSFIDEVVVVKYTGRAAKASDSPKMAEERASKHQRWAGTELELMYTNGKLFGWGTTLEFIED